MQIEDWAEFIKNVLSPAAFKAVAVAALRARYQRTVTLSDGTGDGGVDGWIELSPSLQGKVPAQFHAGRSVEWDRKLKEDIEKPLVKGNPSKRLFFVCAQTPDATKVRRVLADIERDHGIAVTLLDARDLASQVGDPTVADELGKVAMVPLTVRPPPGPPSAADTARLAFIFFHEASGDFRAEIARCALSACLAQSISGAPVEALLDEALALVGGSKSLRRLFRVALSSMIAEGKVLDGGVSVTPTTELVRLVTSMQGAHAVAATKLRDDCVDALKGRVHSAELRELAVDEVFDDLGLLLRRSLVEKLPGGHADALAPRLNAVERRLSDRLKPTGGSAHDALHALVRVASDSVFGRALASAELFAHLTGREAGEVARALTGRDRLEVLLDTSVAMPMLCAKLDRVARGWVTSDVALELHESLHRRNIRMVVPHLYLEEMAAHLITAARSYRDIIGEDPALVGSENFFVAHYHAASASSCEPPTKDGFEELLEGLGLPSAWETLDFLVLRRKIERSLKEHLARYAIEVTRVTYTDAMPLNDEPARHPTVLEHDRLVVHWLDERAKDSNDGLVLCSQDRWLLQVVVDPDWLPIEPAALLDVIQLVRSRDDATPLSSLRELAATIGDVAITRGAVVWDFLAEFEGTRLADHQLLRRAKQFKEAWLAGSRAAERPHAAAWQRFKAGLSLEG